MIIDIIIHIFIEKVFLLFRSPGAKGSMFAILITVYPSSVVVRRPMSVVRRLSSGVRRKPLTLNIISTLTTGPISTKLHMNVSLVALFQNCSKL